jgi:hypothetical protein
MLYRIKNRVYRIEDEQDRGCTEERMSRREAGQNKKDY